jgi:hypothetical protein
MNLAMLKPSPFFFLFRIVPQMLEIFPINTKDATYNYLIS